MKGWIFKSNIDGHLVRVLYDGGKYIQYEVIGGCTCFVSKVKFFKEYEVEA